MLQTTLADQRSTRACFTATARSSRPVHRTQADAFSRSVTDPGFPAGQSSAAARGRKGRLLIIHQTAYFRIETGFGRVNTDRSPNIPVPSIPTRSIRFLAILDSHNREETPNFAKSIERRSLKKQSALQDIVLECEVTRRCSIRVIRNLLYEKSYSPSSTRRSRIATEALGFQASST